MNCAVVHFLINWDSFGESQLQFGWRDYLVQSE
jgi:hypothetical protein